VSEKSPLNADKLSSAPCGVIGVLQWCFQNVPVRRQSEANRDRQREIERDIRIGSLFLLVWSGVRVVGPSEVLQECYKSFARVLQECYKCVTRVSQECRAT
jgi:hypothetical protein